MQTPNGQRNYSYDAVGNRTGIAANGQPLVTYSYDPADRLTNVTQYTSGVPSGISSYTYNPLGDRLTSTFTNPLDAAEDTSSRYLLDMNQSMTMVMGEFSDTSDTYYLLGLGVIGQQTDTNWSYMGYDGLGSLRQVRVDTPPHDRRDRLAIPPRAPWICPAFYMADEPSQAIYFLLCTTRRF